MTRRRQLIKFVTLSAMAATFARCSTRPTPQGNKAQRGAEDSRSYSDIHVVAIGDTGTREAGQLEVAEALNRFYEREPFSHLLLLGDNVYPDGKASEIESSILIPYKNLIERGVEFRAVLGNHDIMTEDGKPQLSLSMLNLGVGHYVFECGAVTFVGIDTNPDHWNLKQQEWLRDTLESRTTPHCIVYGHHPIFSSGWHGDAPSLIESLWPILKEAEVDFYFCGHEHSYERLVPQFNAPQLVIAGNGAVLRPVKAGRFSAHASQNSALFP